MEEFTEDFESIVINETALLDLRATIEFQNGAFINATNLPLLSDKERELVGTRYKEAGLEHAYELAKRLVTPHLEERMEGWINYFHSNPHAYIYCFRGGERSRVVQSWLKAREIDRPRLKGGYKAFRNFLMRRSEEVSRSVTPIILGGRTGCGKTILLNRYQNSLDLEALANHRGSAFGRGIDDQPTQINFENSLSYRLIQLHHKGFRHILLEDEGKHIGRLYLPKALYQNLMLGQLIILERTVDERVEIIYDEYVTKARNLYQKVYGNNFETYYSQDVDNSLDRIKKRLGDEIYRKIKEAFWRHTQSGDLIRHKEWIALLLNHYYDKMYDYQIEKSKDRIIFQGDENGVIAFIEKMGFDT